MSRKITTFKKDLLSMEVGERKEYSRKLHNGYMVSASTLKSKGLGQWKCSCTKFDRTGYVERVL